MRKSLIALGLVAVILVTSALIKFFIFDSNDACKTPNENLEFCRDPLNQ